MNLRTASRLSVVALVVVVGAILYLTRGSWAAPGPPSLIGTTLGGTAAPEFQLVDVHGGAVTLAQFRGEPVIVTFMSSQCDATCDQSIARVRAALSQLGAGGSRVAVLVVSLDQTVGSTGSAAFAQRLPASSHWHYLTGTCAALRAVWRAYSVFGSGCAPDAVGGSAQRSHALGLYLLDARGREQVYLDSSFSAASLAADLRTLSAA